ncbi:MAG: carboxypeptidase regulatory-like domain-containing protein [Bacteroidales bacterium]|nr:carboxypeptidase regulatory-like domain-containing protein [Bacteroidales bacterium]
MKKWLLLALVFLTGLSTFSQTTVTIGTGTSTSYMYGPIYRSSSSSSYDYSSYCYLLTADELYNAGVCNGAVISQLAWDKVSTFTSNGNATFTIYLKNSSLTTLTTGTQWQNVLAGATMVYQNTAQTIPAAGWLNFPLGTSFTYTGGALEVIVDWDCSMISGSPSTGSYTWHYTSALTFNGTIGRASSSAITPTTTLNTSSYGGTNRPNIQITYTGGVCGPGNPASFTATTVSSSQIDVAFTPNTNTDPVAIVWNLTGVFTDPLGAPPAPGQPFAGGTLLYYGLASPQNHTGLTPATTYYYKGFSYDGATYSAGSTADATTLCVAVPMPWSEGFNASTIPTCWSTFIVADPGTDPVISFETTGTSPVCTPPEGTHMVKFNSYNCSSGASIRLISGPFSSVGATNVTVAFKWHQDPGYSSYLNEGMTVQWSTDAGNTWNSGNFYQRYDPVIGWRDMVETLPPAAANQPDVLLGFLFYSQYGNNCYMDFVDVYEQQTGDLSGYVTELSTGNPLAGAVVDCGGYLSAPSAPDGSYTITNIVTGTYDVYCSLAGYNTGVANGVVISSGMNTQNFALTQPTMTVTPPAITMDVYPGFGATSTITVTNNGNGPLNFSGYIQFLTDQASLTFTEVPAAGPSSPDIESAPGATIMENGTDNKAMWDVAFSFDANEGAQPGLETDGQYIYTSTWSSSFTTPFWFHKYDFFGNVVSEFDIAGATAIRDMAYDGTYFYGGAATNLIYIMDFTTQTLVGTIPTATGVTVRHIAYDPLANGGAGGFWVGDFGTLYLVSMSGTTLTTVAAPGMTGMYGSAYDGVTPGGPYLWLFDPATTGATPYVKQFDIATLALTGVQHDATDLPGFNAGIAGGLCSWYNASSGQFLLIGSMQQTPNLVFGYVLQDGWVDFTPKTGTVAGSKASMDLTVTFNSLSYPVGTTKTAIAHFNSDPNVGTGQVALTMNVIAPTNTVDWCNLQWPPSANINAGQTTTIYARIWEDGVTNFPGPGSGVNAWIGVSTTDTDPATWTNWIPAIYNQDYGNDDEWMADIGAGLMPGTYYYASRFNLGGGPDAYGGYNAGGGGFWDGINNVSGILTIGNPSAMVWTGTIDSDWHNPGNWDIYAVPGPGTDVTIPSGLTNYPTLGTPGTCNNILIESNTAGTATLLDAGLLTVNGTSTVQRYYAGGGGDVPEMIYYKFENPGGADVPNDASSPVGNNPAPVLGMTMGGTGQFGSALIGTGASSSTSYVNVGWSVNLPSTGWTISMWLDIPSSTTLYYLFGDPGASSFRCFAGGVAGAGNLIIRGGGLTDTYINGVAPGPSVAHFVYTGSSMDVYLNGAYQGSVAQPSVTIAGTGFKVGGYSTSTGLNGSMDEFRMYSRALTPTEIADSWNVLLPQASTAWHLISSPISNALSGLYTGMYLQTYHEATMQWIDIIPTTINLLPLKGYALWVGELAVDYVGPFNTGNIGYLLKADNPYGWNLLGNPYPSSIDWDMVTIPGYMNGAIYYLDAVSGNYVSYNGGMGGGSQYVPPMQGFFVSSTAQGPFYVDNSVRSHVNGSSYYKEELVNMAVIQASGNGFTDKTYIRFDESSSYGFDGQFDAYKLSGLEFNSQLPQIFTLAGHELSINVQPFAETIAAGFRSGVSGNFTIGLSELRDISVVILEDLVTGTLTDLTQGSYSFDYTTSDDPNRFLLHFAPLAIPENADQNVSIYAFGKDVYVSVPDNMSGDIQVFNMMGQAAISTTVSSALNKITVAEAGTYVVRLISGKEVITETVIIR